MTAIKNDFIEKLSKPPRRPKKDLHYWADYIEVLCLINIDGVISQNDFIDRIKDIERDLEDSDVLNENEKNIQINETLNLFAEDNFKLLEYRAAAFSIFYPFQIAENGKALHLTTNLTLEHKIYLSLLLSSTLNYFQSFKTSLTSSFERFSHEVLKNLLPEKISKSYVFGSSNTEDLKEDGTEHSLFWDKINGLAKEIKETVLINKKDISKYNKGDGGLDLVGWIELGDSNSHFPLFFCQCACTPEWTKKQNSSKFDKWNNFLSFSTYPLNVIFIPFSFRSSNGEWHESQAIEKSILIDRQRLINNFKNKESFKEFDSIKIIDHVLSQKESVV